MTSPALALRSKRPCAQTTEGPGGYEILGQATSNGMLIYSDIDAPHRLRALDLTTGKGRSLGKATIDRQPRRRRVVYSIDGSYYRLSLAGGKPSPWRLWPARPTFATRRTANIWPGGSGTTERR